jgi:hypothetical protein
MLDLPPKLEPAAAEHVKSPTMSPIITDLATHLEKPASNSQHQCSEMGVILLGGNPALGYHGYVKALAEYRILFGQRICTGVSSKAAIPAHVW